MCLHFLSPVFINNCFAKWDTPYQASGDYNAKFGVTILGTFLNLICIMWFIYLFIYLSWSEYETTSTNWEDLVFLVRPGESVTVEDEVVVVNSIVLPHKTLNVGVQDEILL